jgi:hypothetical protein
MPITYRLRSDEKLVILVHRGIVTDEEFLSFYRTLYEENRFDNSLDLLVDLRQTESASRSAGALSEFAEFIRNHFSSTTAGPKVAVVAPKDISFGLARMYEAMSGDVPFEFAVFRTSGEALSWLGMSESLIDDLDEDPRSENSPGL